MIRDANDQYYPLAFVVVETENKESWKWFLNGLLTNIGDPETYKWVLISDRQKVIKFNMLLCNVILCNLYNS